VNELDRTGEEILHGALRSYWHPVLYAEELGERPVGVTLLDEPVVVVRLGAGVRAFTDLCVHRGTPLSLGWIENGELVCAYHGWCYGEDGVCTRIPAVPDGPIPARARLRRFHAEERHGLVWVCLGDEPRLPIPDYPEFDDEEYRTIRMPTYDWACGAARRIENFVDFSHFPFVHDGVLGSRDNPVTPEHEVEAGGADISFSISLEEPVDPLKNEDTTVEAPLVRRYTDYRLSLPFTAYLNQKLPGGRHFVLFMASAPLGRRATRSFTFISRNYQTEPEQDRAFVEMQETILEQDRPVVEAQRPEELPVDLSAELHIRGPDRASVLYRKWLIEVVRAEA
jgi:phenylpropionate dioxygenase-like ring-hydroxylating dioxygenase large terminal subunit